MAKKILFITDFFLTGTIILSVLYLNTSCEILLSLAITFGTATYHFILRLLVGLVFSYVMQNKADYGKRWYQVGKLEMAIYEKLKVNKWKGKMPTYDRTLFDPRIHTWDESVKCINAEPIIHRQQLYGLSVLIC